MNTKSDSNYLDVLQLFRGIAAIMVVLHHSISSIKYYHKINMPFLYYLGSIGKYGVDFFFVLSGFIITYSALDKYNQPNSFSNYVKNRMIRIYVPYLPIGVFMLLVYTYLPSFSNGNREISAITSMTLVPHGNPALSAAWTLTFELCFYLLFSISFLSRKIWNCFVGLWLVALIIINYSKFCTGTFLNNSALRILFSTYNFEFILGYVLALLVVQKIKLHRLLSTLLLVLFLMAFLYFTFNNLNLFAFDVNLLFAIAAFLSIFIASSIDNLKINKTAVMMLVGNATYSIYLIHNPLQMILMRLFPEITTLLGVIIALTVVLILSCFVGYLYYLVFEKKGISYIKLKFIK